MNGNSFRRARCLSAIVLALGWAAVAHLGSAGILPPGLRPKPLGVHALVGGKVTTQPGETLESATIIIRDGYFEEVGKNVSVPADARVWNCAGLTIYAGFIESYLPLGRTNIPISTADSESVDSNSLTAGGISFYGVPGQRTDSGQRGAGYEVSKVTPEYRSTQTYSPDHKVVTPLRELGFSTAVVAPAGGIVRGSSALVSLVEADPNDVILKPDVFQHLALETHDRDERAYPGSLMGAIAVLRQSFLDAQHYALDQADWQKHPGGRQRPEFDPSLEALQPASTGKQRVLIEPGSALMVDRMARVARELKLDFAFVSSGQEWRRPDLAKETGATFVVPLNFPSLPKLPDDEDWEQVTLDQLRAWDWAAENPALLRQQGLEIALTTYSLKDKQAFRKNLELAMDRGLTEIDAIAALTTVPAKLAGVEKQLGTIEAGKIANLTIVDGNGYFDPEARIREVWVEGRNYHVQSAKEVAKKEPSGELEKTAKDKKTAELKELNSKRVAWSPTARRKPDEQLFPVRIDGAVIWTCGSQGVLTNGALLVSRGGKISAVEDLSRGTRYDDSGKTVTINGKGTHVTPGLVDAHSHAAILGAVNEGTLPSTAMVRIGDVVNSETRNIQDQLAGGLTVANLLHGSANPIGGQNQIIKLRDGASPEEMKFEGAPQGIKFALGENVKQSNWGEKFKTRFPQTRMGVPTFYRNRFTAAQQYLQAWADYQQNGDVPPRRDLELEAIGEIIAGQRFIHCHSYRQDEILAFLRVMEEFNVRVGTLQHILEGYKVADEIVGHGAGASCFADWWAYKFEVYDAIPYNGALMHNRGVLVSFNSDSPDLARRLNTEAAKSIKFGGMTEEEALKFVTINPAKQLGIDQRVGSLEPGKDADFVVWSGNPLDSRSVVLQTWIDGRKYFDRDEAARRAEALQQERGELLAKARKLQTLSGGGVSKEGGGEGREFFRVSLEHEFDGVARHCLDEEVH